MKLPEFNSIIGYILENNILSFSIILIAISNKSK